jgi:ABC-type amino acid transport substrate-binding protein
MQLFAKHIGVKYEYVKADWPDVFPSLIGKKVTPKGTEVELGEAVPVKGDVIANGVTILPWRQKVVSFSEPYFPNQVWLVAEASSPLKPIKPSGNLEEDIKQTKLLMKGHTLMGKSKTCLDPSLYKLEEVGAAKISLFEGSLNFIAPALLLKKETEVAILDIPDILVAQQKWGGKLKVLGPVSGRQDMGIAFAKDAPELKKAFDEFFTQIREDGTFKKIASKYYSGVFSYFPTFFDPVKKKVSSN